MLQDLLEDYIDVSVGNANKIDPAFLIEEKLDFLIIGDIISKTINSLEIQNWLIKYWEFSKSKNLNIKAISGFYVAPTEINIEPFWVDFLHDNVRTEIKYPPILRLMLNKGEIALENGAYDKVKVYSNDCIEFFVENKKRI